MEIKPTYLGTMIAPPTVAFGLIGRRRLEQAHLPI